MEFPLTVSEIQDTHVPESLKLVINGIEALSGPASRNQLITGLFYVLMQECGFTLIPPKECFSNIPKNETDGNEKRTMTFNLQRLIKHALLVSPLLASPSGTYKLPLQLVGVDNYQFQLLVIPSAEDLIIVNLLITNEEYNECFSIALRVSTFVPKPKAVNIADKFFDLQTLSVIFKDNIANKGRSVVLNAEGIVNNSLIGLMDEVKMKILEALPIEDLLNLLTTCRSMHIIKYDVTIWRMLLWRDFHYRASEEESSTVENLISIYKLQKVKKATQTPIRRALEHRILYGYYDIDSDSDTPAVSRNSSYDFTPYYISLGTNPVTRSAVVLEEGNDKQIN